MKKAQGEIFGIALFFVVLIVGLLVYSQIKALNPDLDEVSQQSSEYKILAAETILGIKKMSTGCEVQNERDSIEDLMKMCYDLAIVPSSKVMRDCGDGTRKDICKLAIEKFNQSLNALFNSDPDKAIIGSIPYVVRFHSPDFDKDEFFMDPGTYNEPLVLTNMQDVDSEENFFLSFDDATEPNYYSKQGYKRISADPQFITTGRRSIEIEVNLYYK